MASAPKDPQAIFAAPTCHKSSPVSFAAQTRFYTCGNTVLKAAMFGRCFQRLLGRTCYGKSRTEDGE